MKALRLPLIILWWVILIPTAILTVMCIGVYLLIPIKQAVEDDDPDYMDFERQERQ